MKREPDLVHQAAAARVFRVSRSAINQMLADKRITPEEVHEEVSPWVSIKEIRAARMEPPKESQKSKAKGRDGIM